MPIGWLEPPIIPSNKLRFLKDADLWDFGMLTSRMHVAWLRYIGGRIKSDFQYSIGIVYNCFPWPNAEERQKQVVREKAKAVLDARTAHSSATLADLYDQSAMPLDLRDAHRSLDREVDRLYRREPFESDRARVEHLFAMYEVMAAPLMATARQTRKKRR